jgi:hypothetical protein
MLDVVALITFFVKVGQSDMRGILPEVQGANSEGWTEKSYNKAA